jgi:AcrR family transcriptional regulator
VPRPKVHDDALRVRLLERAVRTLSQEGPDALSLRKQAAQVGTSTTAVYSLFGGKQALLNAVFDEAFGRFGERLANVESRADPVEELLALANAYRANALAEPHFYQVMFGPAGASFQPDADTEQRAKETFTPLVTAIQRAMEAGELSAGDPIEVATTMWACVHGMVSLELRNLLPESGDPERLYLRAVTAMFVGWRPAPVDQR